MGKWSNVSVFELVTDPWLPIVYAGIFMLLIGAVGMFLTAGRKKREEVNKMISWNHFILFAIASVLCWATGAWGAWKEKRKLAFAATGVGLAIFFTYIVLMWISLERPPLRTMGENAPLV